MGETDPRVEIVAAVERRVERALVTRLREHATDWNGQQMPDAEPVKGDPTAGFMRAAAATIERLSAEVARLTVERDEFAEAVVEYGAMHSPDGMEILAKDRDKWFDRATAAEAEVADLRAKLATAAGEDTRCVVWSHQHSAWWRANGHGYARDVREAGVYSHDEAVNISHRCRDQWVEGDRPTELAVRLADLPDWARTALAAIKEPRT